MSLTCWDVLAGRQCPRGLAACRYCQADAGQQKFQNASLAPVTGTQTAKVASLAKKGAVTLFNFSEEWRTLDEADLLKNIRRELEAFGALADLRMLKSGDMAFASFVEQDCAHDAVQALSDSTFDISFELCHGLKVGLGGHTAQKPGPPSTPIWNTCLYIDELDMPKRPNAEPAKTDCEVWIDPMPNEEDLAGWTAAFGDVDKVFRIPTLGTWRPSDRGYVKFKAHDGARACVAAGAGRWSESERALSYQMSAGSQEHCYPDSIVSGLIGKQGTEINALAARCGLTKINVMTPDSSSYSSHLHIKAVGEPSSIELVRPELEKRLAELHEDISSHMGRYGRGMVIHIDELSMPHRPDVEPVSKDREVWVARVPDDSELGEWKSSFGRVEEVFCIPSSQANPLEERGYVRFREHSGAKACVEAGIGVWSESERALCWQGFNRNTKKADHTYPAGIVGWFLHKSGERLKELAAKCGILIVNLCGERVRDSAFKSSRIHFVAEGGRKPSLEKLKAELELKLEEFHKEMSASMCNRQKRANQKDFARQRKQGLHPGQPHRNWEVAKGANAYLQQGPELEDAQDAERIMENSEQNRFGEEDEASHQESDEAIYARLRHANAGGEHGKPVTHNGGHAGGAYVTERRAGDGGTAGASGGGYYGPPGNWRRSRSRGQSLDHNRREHWGGAYDQNSGYQDRGAYHDRSSPYDRGRNHGQSDRDASRGGSYNGSVDPSCADRGGRSRSRGQFGGRSPPRRRGR